MIKILAIDTSTDACSAALLYDKKNSNRFIIAAREHTKLILPMIHELLTEAHLDLNELDAIAFGYGPGSFTGIRLAASITQGLAFASNLPVIKISCLRALAQEAFVEFGNKKVLVAQDARMNEIYYGEYQSDSFGIMQAIIPDQLTTPEKINTTNPNPLFTRTGNGWEIYDNTPAKLIYPRAQYIAELAAIDFAKNLTVLAAEALPIYLREEVAWNIMDPKI